MSWYLGKKPDYLFLAFFSDAQRTSVQVFITVSYSAHREWSKFRPKFRIALEIFPIFVENSPIICVICIEIRRVNKCHAISWSTCCLGQLSDFQSPVNKILFIFCNVSGVVAHFCGPVPEATYCPHFGNRYLAFFSSRYFFFVRYLLGNDVVKWLTSSRY